MSEMAQHWADVWAEKIIRERGEKERYVCAAGITPSGTVHIGNFREIISVDLVVRALQRRGKNVRFIYSWDDYDVFRKVPANMPDPQKLKQYLRQPITLTPDPYGEEESYARHNEKEIERLLPRMGVHPEFIYQAKRYQSSVYAEGIRTALEHREKLREILNEHRTAPLPPDWWPITVFCGNCHSDTTEILGWDGGWQVSYACRACGHRETVDLRASGVVKLLWRIDWPMRWAYEGVDFEPAGKDHHSEGGSFDTAERIVREVYGAEPPISFQYDFIGIKGRSGKISSSSGEVVSLADVLEIYQPEVVRYLFAGTRPNSEFVISFDLDVIKIYEDYDRTERIACGEEPVAEKRAEKERRIYELSQVAAPLPRMPVQVPFRHLCNLLQTYRGDMERVFRYLDVRAEGGELERLRTRAACAWSWTSRYAPEEFRFTLRGGEEPPLEVNEQERRALGLLRQEIEQKLATHDEKSLSTAIYDIARQAGMDPKEFFRLAYRVLINQDRGPRLAGFLLIIDREKTLALLSRY
jgi:lysyl-tRNA synthetase class 1